MRDVLLTGCRLSWFRLWYPAEFSAELGVPVLPDPIRMDVNGQSTTAQPGSTRPWHRRRRRLQTTRSLLIISMQKGKRLLSVQPCFIEFMLHYLPFVKACFWRWARYPANIQHTRFHQVSPVQAGKNTQQLPHRSWKLELVPATALLDASGAGYMMGWYGPKWKNMETSWNIDTWAMKNMAPIPTCSYLGDIGGAKVHPIQQVVSN